MPQIRKLSATLNNQMFRLSVKCKRCRISGVVEVTYAQIIFYIIWLACKHAACATCRLGGFYDTKKAHKIIAAVS